MSSNANVVGPVDICPESYACGHSRDGEFKRCEKHAKTDNERCGGGTLQYADVKRSNHKCRICNNSAS